MAINQSAITSNYSFPGSPAKTPFFEHFPTLGWVDEPTPVTRLNNLSAKSGAGWLGCKRDDLCNALFGGSKVRKLDFILPNNPYCDATSWASLGAIGSGHMVACSAAANALNKKFDAYLFWEPITEGVLDNLSFVVNKADSVFFYNSRLDLALSKPRLFLGNKLRGSKIIPFGATCPRGILGLVKAGLELATQVKAGELPEPKRIYVALGSGGTTAGLALGIALGGLKIAIHAVAAVEKFLCNKFRLNKLISKTKQLLIDSGLKQIASVSPVTVHIDHSQIGNGYGYATDASMAAMEVFKQDDIQIEPVYTGKAAAAMLADLQDGVEGPVLFWNTMRRSLPEIAKDWKQKLPKTLLKKINQNG